MLTHNFTRKSNMNVIDVLNDNVPDKIYSSIVFTLVNLPYKANSIDIESICIDGVDYKSYKNHYRFRNGTMNIIKIASTEFVPYGIYARKIINFLISEFSYKYSMPHIYECDQSKRMVRLGKKPIDFIEKICGIRKVGKTRNLVLQQLQAILNCKMAVATGYKQINPNDDEICANDRYQFALINSGDKSLVSHKFDVFSNWQEEIYISDDLADMLSRKIMPLNRDVYMRISSPMELDIFQYFTYQSYNASKDGKANCECSMHWDEVFKVFGRGYAKSSKGLANFRADFRKNTQSLMQKANLSISMPLDAKSITFKPIITQEVLKRAIGLSDSIADDNSNDLYLSIKSDLDKLPKINNSVDSGNWDIFVGRYDILKLCDKSAIACVKRYFDLDAELTKKTIEYANTQKMRNPSAYLVAALNEKWIKLADEFSKRVNLWQNIYAGLSFEQKRKIDNVVSNSVTRLVDKWSPEPIDSNIVRLIYARYIDINDSDIVLRELVGSRYQTYFMRDRGLFDML